MEKITHDELYKKYLRQSYGPNLFPFIHSIVLIFSIILILISTLFLFNTTLNKKEVVIETIPNLEKPIISIE